MTRTANYGRTIATGVAVSVRQSHDRVLDFTSSVSTPRSQRMMEVSSVDHKQDATIRINGNGRGGCRKEAIEGEDGQATQHTHTHLYCVGREKPQTQ
jgi:hypothetical protein